MRNYQAKPGVPVLCPPMGDKGIIQTEADKDGYVEVLVQGVTIPYHAEDLTKDRSCSNKS
jgi:hypothetical protein